MGIIIQNLVSVVAAYVIAFIAGWKMTLVITAIAPLVGVGAWLGAKAMLGFSNQVCVFFKHIFSVLSWLCLVLCFD